jgi:type IV fimbrial biogenesis protein FimT
MAMKLSVKLLTKPPTKLLVKVPTKLPMKLPIRPRTGFSIAELMVVLAIAAIMAAMALPNLGTVLRAQHLKVAVNDLFGSIGMARAQALARNARVQLSPRDPLGADWSLGWTVFVDRDDDGVPGAGDEILSEHAALARGIAIRFAFSSAAAPFYIAYNGAGRSTSNTSDAARFGTVSLFQDGAIRRIKINMLGRARVCDPARDDSCEGADAP